MRSNGKRRNRGKGFARDTDHDPQVFQQSIASALNSSLFTKRGLGGALGVGVPQIERWANGVSMPPEPMRKTVVRVIRRKAAERVGS